MSTNKTQHYHLHAWAAGDNFLRTEINENFTALDTALKTEADVLDAALKTEVNARVADVREEADARAALKTELENAIKEEADARAAAVKAETDARTAAVTAEVNARKSAVSGEASARTSAINAAKNELKGQISALSTTLQSRGQLVVGSYVGNTTVDRAISLGKPIKALFLECDTGARNVAGHIYGGFLLPGTQLPYGAARLEGDKLIVSTSSANDNRGVNIADVTYMYFAWVDCD